MKKLFFLLIIGAIFSLLGNGDDCSKEALFSYFPKKFVANALEKYHIPKDLWENIETMLTKKDKDIMKIVEKKANALDPSLLQDFSKRKELTALFKETLLEIFASVMKDNGITDMSLIKQILEDIENQKIDQFKGCLNVLKESLK